MGEKILRRILSENELPNLEELRDLQEALAVCAEACTLSINPPLLTL